MYHHYFEQINVIYRNIFSTVKYATNLKFVMLNGLFDVLILIPN